MPDHPVSKLPCVWSVGVYAELGSLPFRGERAQREVGEVSPVHGRRDTQGPGVGDDTAIDGLPLHFEEPETRQSQGQPQM